MMTEPLYVQTDGVQNYSQLHSDVASGLSGLLSDGSQGSGVNVSHGAIASSVSSALSNVLSGREGTLGVTSTAASTISDLLQKAAQAYARGDQEGAERLRTAADVLDGKPTTPSSGIATGTGGVTGSANGGAPTPGGGEMAGQMGQVMGQVGQAVGQLVQGIVQPLQGLAQGLQQIPQQIMQGTQQAAQAGRQLDAPEVDLPDGEQDSEKIDERREKDKDGDKESTGESTAQAGESATSGTVPIDPPATEQRPAPTRPQTE